MTFRLLRPRDFRQPRPVQCADCGSCLGAGLHYSTFSDHSVCARCGTIYLTESDILIRVDEYADWMFEEPVCGGSC